MKRAFKIIGSILLILILGAVIIWFGFLKPEPPPISPDDRTQITLMPLPAELKLTGTEFGLHVPFSHSFKGLATPRLDRAMERFYHRLNNQTGFTFGKAERIALILDCTGTELKYPHLDDDESYTLKINKNVISIQAPSESGIIYGLETILQLVTKEDSGWILPGVKISDRPRYPWRGLMIDACRHWIPKEVILRNLDAMAVAKMNVFHWHLTEDQGFRVESKLFPKLHEMGSNGDYYSQEEISEVVEYAADRGIRVVPEFDVPGHTASWFIGHPELASAPGPYSIITSIAHIVPVMDPTRKEVYDFLNRFLGEMVGLFPDQYLHIGGDEVVPTQWNESPDIQKYMKTNELDDAHALQAHFNKRLLNIVANHNRIMLGWDEILHPGISDEKIAVQTWRDHASLWESARMDIKAILSAGYYLDHKQSAGYHYQVDPTVIPGAVDIEIDSTNWKSWNCTISVGKMLMEGAIYLFGEGDNLRGIMEFMGSTLGFEEVLIEGEHFKFTVKTSVGDLTFALDQIDDSINGEGKLSMFTLAVKGERSGGSDLAEGEPLPEFKKIVELTPEQEKNLIGGEACMWSEMVDGNTIESRIWPRAAVIGEKLWSPKVLTGDESDMYRRMMVMDHRLEELGLQHHLNSANLLSDMVEPSFLEPLVDLVNVLQEDILFNRMAIYQPEFNFRTPLTRVVDAAGPESLVAFRFGSDVDLWLDSGDQEARLRIIESLESWKKNFNLLAGAFEESDQIKEVKAHSINLSRLATLGLESLENEAAMKILKADSDSIIASAREAHGGTILPLWEHVQKLVNAALEN